MWLWALNGTINILIKIYVMLLLTGLGSWFLYLQRTVPVDDEAVSIVRAVKSLIRMTSSTIEGAFWDQALLLMSSFIRPLLIRHV